MKSSHLSTLFCLGTLCLSTACSNGVEQQIAPSTGQGTWHGIINGIPATERVFDPVVRLTVWGQGLCSGTVISDNYVLTAAHCFFIHNCRHNSVSGQSICDLEDRPELYSVDVFERGASSSRQTRQITEIHIHEAYDHTDYINDIALVKLERPFEGISPIPALPNEPGLAWTAADKDKVVTFVGYGLNEFGESGRRLKIDNPVHTVCLEENRCDAWSVSNTICHEKGDGLICSGDSGGPLLIERDGITYVGGVTSYGDEGCKRFGCSTAVSSFSGWIAERMGGNGLSNGHDCVENSQCNSGICTLGICCDSVCTDEPCQACSAYRGRDGSEHGTCGNARAPCDDSDACTLGDSCIDGVCTSGAPKICPAEDQCNAASQCDSATGQCLDKVPFANGTACDDHNACTLNDICFLGSCVSEGRVVCPDRACQRHVGAGCLPATGACIYENLEDGTVCITSTGATSTCVSGECIEEKSSGCGAVPSSENTPSWGGWLTLILATWLPTTWRRQSRSAHGGQRRTTS